MLFALLVASAVLLEAAYATHFTAPEDTPWGSAAHQGIRLSASLLPRLKSFAEKRHQSLLPYHPVVRFRGLGGPGEAWADSEVFAIGRPLGVNANPISTEIAAALEMLETKAQTDAEVRDALNAGDLLRALETLAKEENNAAKGIRFGIRKR